MFDEEFEKAFAGGDAEMLMKVRAYRTRIPGKYANAMGLNEAYEGWRLAAASADKSQAAFEAEYLDLDTLYTSDTLRQVISSSIESLRDGNSYRRSFATVDLCNMWKGWSLYVKSN